MTDDFVENMTFLSKFLYVHYQKQLVGPIVTVILVKINGHSGGADILDHGASVILVPTSTLFEFFVCPKSKTTYFIASPNPDGHLQV